MNNESIIGVLLGAFLVLVCFIVLPILAIDSMFEKEKAKRTIHRDMLPSIETAEHKIDSLVKRMTGEKLKSNTFCQLRDYYYICDIQDNNGKLLKVYFYHNYIDFKQNKGSDDD